VIYVDKGKEEWKKAQRDVIRSSFVAISQRLGTEPVQQCILKHTNLYDGIDKENAYAQLSSLAKSSRWPSVNITSKKLAGKRAGEALVENKTVGSAQPFNITMDNSKISASMDQNGKEWTISQNAGVIVHEILHQMGHLHTDDPGYTKGYFVTVVGDCIASNGITARNAPGFSLLFNGRPWPIYD
jgi:hypothetical protein